MNIIAKISSCFNRKNHRHLNNWTNDEIAEFKKNLSQVILWTESLAKDFDFKEGKYGLVFRQTNPKVNGEEMYSFDGDYATWTMDDYSPDNYDLLLKIAIDSRIDNVQFDLNNIDNLGRILCFQTCVTTHDGAPIVESKNFVDEGDVPPIDTWFFLKKNYYHSDYKCEQSLFCWVPRKFEPVVQQAINVEILDSYRWLDENDPNMYERIKTAGNSTLPPLRG